MNEPFTLIAAAMVGLCAGVIFYGGLWFTVSRLHSAKQPALLFIASFAVRTALALGALWWIARGNVVHIGAWLVGFVLARLLVFRLTGSTSTR